MGEGISGSIFSELAEHANRCQGVNNSKTKKVATWKKRARANVSPHPSPKPLSLGKALGKRSSHNEGDDPCGDKPKLKKQNVAGVLSNNVISSVEAVEQPRDSRRTALVSEEERSQHCVS